MSKEGVTVGVRVRPLLAEQGGEEQCVRVEGGKVAVAGGHRLRQFPFQYVFDRAVPQQQVFELFALPLVEDLFKGHSCSLVAYGQNRSGKSYSTCGGDSEQTKGVIPRIVDHLSCKLYAEESGQRRMILRVSYIDICQEEVIDLLSIRKGVAVEVTERDQQTTLSNVEMKTISAVEDIETQFILGNRKRQLAYSKKYRSSEQSASVFTLYLETIEEGKVRRGKLDIVQMQASDTVSRFQAVLPSGKEKQYDLSVNSFKNVVNSLIYGSSDSVIPYNDSKVTQILRNALGGNSKAKFLFHICPSIKCHDATINTLRTASACQLIENTPSYSFVEHSLIQQVIEQEGELRAQLRAVEDDIKRDEEGGDDEPMEHEDGEGENQFLSRSVLQKKQQEEKESKRQARIQMRETFKKQLHNLHSLFINLPPLKNKHQITFFRDNYASALDRITKNAQNAPSISLYQSAENWTLSETSFRKLNQKQRFYKQQVYDLQRQFQQQRQILLSTLREVTQQGRFFQQVAERVVRPEQLQLLKASSKYDPTRHICHVPAFTIKDKRISHSSRFFSPQQAALINSRAISERKFMMTQIGEKPKESRVVAVKQVKQQQFSQNPYFHRAPKRPQPLKQDTQFRMSQNEYELVRSSVMGNRMRRKPLEDEVRSPSNSSRSVKVRPIKPILSPRFRFK